MDPKPRMLRCAVCGASVLGRQWWNRDEGFGVCVPCAERHTIWNGVEYTRLLFGSDGYHYNLQEQ